METNSVLVEAITRLTFALKKMLTFQLNNNQFAYLDDVFITILKNKFIKTLFMFHGIYQANVVYIRIFHCNLNCYKTLPLVRSHNWPDRVAIIVPRLGCIQPISKLLVTL